MIRSLESVLLSSENAKNLADFYHDKVGLNLVDEMTIGEGGEKGYIFEFNGGANFYILDHSKVKGQNSQPERVMFNLEVDNIENEVAKVKGAGVKVVQDTYHVEGYGLIATCQDLDGNYFQLVQVKPS